MKKIIAGAAFLLFGTMLTMAQATKDNTRKSSEKSAKIKEMKVKRSAQQNATPKMVDTAHIEERQKAEDNKLQRQAIPQKDGLNNEAVKPSQPTPEHLE